MQKNEKKPMTRSEAGRLGAIALNSDPEKKSRAAKKAAAKRKSINPDTFKEMVKLRVDKKKI